MEIEQVNSFLRRARANEIELEHEMLSVPTAEEWNEAALWVLQINRNQMMYRGAMRNMDAYKGRIIYELKKWVLMKNDGVTHREVTKLQQQTASTAHRTEEEVQRGKRSDHDSLPAEVQQLYVDNLHIVQQMRRIHAELGVITRTLSQRPCPASDRYPLLKELKSLDEKYHKNWQTYDDYGRATK